MHKSRDIELSFALAVASLTELVGKEAQRLASKGGLAPADVRVLSELVSTLAALDRGAIWSAKRILQESTP